MSKKFEQLLDYLVNEEMDKANELFHEIVVEKSREIYENMIAEEAQEEDESVAEADDEEQEESVEEDSDEDQDESVEEGFGMDDEADDETTMSIGGENDSADSLEKDVADPHAMDDGEGDGEVSAGEEQILDILAQLKSEFEDIVAKNGGDAGSAEPAEPSFGDSDADSASDDDSDDSEEDSEDDEDQEESMGQPMREYVENVGMNWDKGNTMKTPGPVGSGKGDLAGQATETNHQSIVSSGKGKPTTGANAHNILGDKKTGAGTNVGTTPTGKTGGLVKNPVDMKTGNGNVPGGKMGVKNLAKVPAGHGAEKKGSGPGPVGAGKGDKAGQTSVGVVKSPLNGAPNRNA